MSDLREVFQGKARSGIDDAHSAKMYAIYAKRAEAINSLITLLVVGMVFLVLAAIVTLVAGVIWVWQVLL